MHTSAHYWHAPWLALPYSQTKEYSMADPLPNRGNPDNDNFPSGPNIGESVPTFTLPNQWGESVT